MPWSQRDIETLVTTGKLERMPRPRPTAPRRVCVEFRDGTERRWALLDPDDPLPQTWERAEEATRYSVCVHKQPHSWHVVAVFERPGPRCVRLSHPSRGTCYVPLKEGAPVPQTLEELETSASGTGQWEPCGVVAGDIQLCGGEYE
jgi:hypothetical protein